MDKAAEMQKLCEKDRAEKLAIVKEETEHIKAKKEEFGLESLDAIRDQMPRLTPYMDKGITYAHKDFQIIAKAIEHNEPWAVVSGINPSGPLHLGHLALFKENRALQELGAEIFFPVSEDESYVFEKAQSLAAARENAYLHVIPSLVALGFDPKKTHIFVGSDYPSIYPFALHIARNFSLNHIKGVFGFDDDTNAGVIFYMGGIQMAHILLPQLEEFGGPKPTVVPVGIDQHPYIQISRRFARRAQMIPPAELDMRFLPSLAAPGAKMSASDRSSCIYVTDSVDEAKQKIKTAYTGGSPLMKYQKEFGAVPEVCSICSLLEYHFLDREHALDIKNSCRQGTMMCKDCKKMAMDGVEQLLITHQEAMGGAREIQDQFMLNKPIRSIVEARR